jgi:hypothetical protein
MAVAVVEAADPAVVVAAVRAAILGLQADRPPDGQEEHGPEPAQRHLGA